MADEKVVKQLVDRLSTEDLTGQELAAEQIRQVCTAIRPQAFAQHQLLHNIRLCTTSVANLFACPAET